MTHITLDSAALASLLAAGDAVNHAARNRLCSCEWSNPYSDGHAKRELVTRCFRCRALEQWAQARQPVATAIADADGGAAGPRVAALGD